MSIPLNLQKTYGTVQDILWETDSGHVVSTSKGFAIKISGIEGNLIRDGSLPKLCSSPHVITTTDVQFDPESGNIYLVMPLGQKLPDVPDRKDWRRLLTEMTRGILSCRQAGIIHADINPDNFVMLDNRVVLVNFGLAFPEGFIPEGVNRTGYQVGYKAPEIIRGRSYPTFQTDVWALGVILITWLRNGTNPLEHIFREDALTAIENLQLSNMTDMMKDRKDGRSDSKKWIKEFLEATLDVNPATRAGIDEVLDILTHQRPEIPTDIAILDTQGLDSSEYDFQQTTWQRGLRWLQKFQKLYQRPGMVVSFAISTLKAILFQRDIHSSEIPSAAALAYFLGDIYFGPEPWKNKPSPTCISADFNLDFCLFQDLFSEYLETMEFNFVISHPLAYLHTLSVDELFEIANAIDIRRLDANFAMD